MTLLHAVRWLAYAVAFAAIIDPSWRIHRPAPLTIAVREPEGALAASVGSTPGTILRARLESAMPGTVAINTPAAPRALVVAGSTLDAKALPASGPVSFVLDPEKRATARVISLVSPNPVLP